MLHITGCAYGGNDNEETIGGRCGTRTPLQDPKTRVLPLHYILQMVRQVGLEPTIQMARGLKPRVYTNSTTSAYGGSAQNRTVDCSVMSQGFFQLNYGTIWCG